MSMEPSFEGADVKSCQYSNDGDLVNIATTEEFEINTTKSEPSSVSVPDSNAQQYPQDADDNDQEMSDVNPKNVQMITSEKSSSIKFENIPSTTQIDVDNEEDGHVAAPVMGTAMNSFGAPEAITSTANGNSKYSRPFRDESDVTRASDSAYTNTTERSHDLMEVDLTASPEINITNPEIAIANHETHATNLTGNVALATVEGLIEETLPVNKEAQALRNTKTTLEYDQTPSFPYENDVDVPDSVENFEDLLNSSDMNDFQFTSEQLSDIFGDRAEHSTSVDVGEFASLMEQASPSDDHEKPNATNAANRRELISRELATDPEAILAAAIGDIEEAAMTYSNDLNVNTSSEQQTKETQVADFDSDVEDAKAFAEFTQAKDEYERRRTLGMTDDIEDIEFMRRAQGEQKRRELRKNRRASELAHTSKQENYLFCRDNQQSSAPSENEDFDTNDCLEAALDSTTSWSETKSHKARKDNKQDEGKDKSRRRKAMDGDRVSGSRVSKSSQNGNAKKSRAKQSKSRVKRGPNLYFNNNTIADAQANAGKADQPEITHKVKSRALAELIASMPEDQQKLHVGDRNELEKASKRFNSGHGAVKSVPETPTSPSGWLLRGMKSTLKHYQLLGVAFMRDRENDGPKPRGGFMADEMGLGKTVMAIANIIDGRAKSPRKGFCGATLIVCPSTLMSQWLAEFQLHANTDTVGQVQIYRGGNKFQSNDPIAWLSGLSIVITSYIDVMRSWPKYLPPIECTTPAMRDQWYREICEKSKGILHRVAWNRIILDEAQAIKNKDSQTSKAVCELIGDYRWAISGTPVQNSLEEFYPFFKFLKLPHADSWEQFKHNFSRRGNYAGLNRLRAYLQKYMVRRTHKDQFFGRPILKLPEPSSQTIPVKFNDVERKIYHIVRTRFVNRIQAFVREDNIKNAYSSIFVLLLRLRQLVCHVLLIQKTLTDLLEPVDLEQLWDLTESQEHVNKKDGSTEILQGLRMALTEAQAERNIRNRASTVGLSDSGIEVGEQNTDDDLKFTLRFKKCLETMRDNGKWAEIYEKSRCIACGDPPKQPYITSCQHCYCLECLKDMRYAATIRGEEAARCMECGLVFTGAERCKSYREITGIPGPMARKKKSGSASDNEENSDWFFLGGPIMQSAKTKATVLQCRAWLQQDPNAKIIVFTQWRGMITCLSRICREQKWGYTTFSGDMTFDARDRSIQKFSSDPECKVFLCSMKAGGVGLNLTAASRVIIMDLWWNQYVETQAFCRVFRIGQTRPVEMIRFVVENSVDTDILRMQERKNKEINDVMDDRHRKLDTRSLLALFGPNPDDNDHDDGNFIFSYQTEAIEIDDD